MGDNDNDISRRVKELEKRVRELKFDADLKELSRFLDVKVTQPIHRYADQSKARALAFVQEQTATWLLQAMVLSTALHMASEEYHGVLGVKDASKGLTGDILFAVALVLAPELGFIAKGLEVWKDNAIKVKKLVSALGRNASDMYDATIAKVGQSTGADHSSLNKANASKAVISKYMAEANRQIALSILVQSLLTRYINEIEASTMTEQDIRRMWLNHGLTILDVIKTATTVALISGPLQDTLSKSFLYDMLRAYAYQHCEVVISAMPAGDEVRDREKRMPWSQALPQKLTMLVGEFRGMSQESRNEIYNRFGDSWAGVDSNRPPIRGYRDMVAHWGVTIVH